MRRSLAVAVVLITAVSVGWSGDLADVSLPDEVTVSEKTLTLNGMGVRKKLWIEVYVAGLYLEETSSDPVVIATSDQVKHVVMVFKTNKAKKKKMDSAWDEGFEGNTGENFEGLADRVEQFKGYFGDMKTDDRVEYTMISGEGTTVVLNGKTMGTIEGDDFIEALMMVWLGPKPPSEDLKLGMLGS
ncbi:MAG: hypothetical protein GY906_19565 [bacterium]|nr:hypothetical protein [bacterium]